MDPEESRSPQKQYLYQNERKYLLSEGTGSRSEGEIRKQIRSERLPRLTNRIQHLIDDVALLNNRDFLTSEIWEDGWDQLQDLEYRPELRDPPVWLPNTELSGFTRIGFVLGQFARTVSSDVGPDYDSAQLTWGFLLGAVGRPQGNYRREHREIEEILRTIEKQFSRRKETVEEQKVETESQRLEDDLSISTSVPTLFDGSAFREYQEKAAEERQRIKNSNEPTESEFFQLLNEVIEADSEKIISASNLSRRIRRSIHEIQETSRRKVPAQDPFQTLYDADGAMNSGKIAADCGTHKKIVSYLMDTLAGEKDAELWADYPLVVEDPQRRGRKWEMTTFGKLVGACLFEEEGMETVHQALAETLTNGTAEEEYIELIKEILEPDED
ncbi:hypothetical protein [Halobellus marinus]|uniref:hypothetical protein n=1 Tax=Halobellus TaxID=1073986 RepID=UPI0028AAB5EB|nr:hypothetical protein [Halobellus sp. DFY28]